MYCVCCGKKKYEKYMYVIVQPYNSKKVNVCWVCYNLYSSLTRVLKLGMSTAEDRLNLIYELNKK